MKKGYELALELLGVMNRDEAIDRALEYLLHAFSVSNVSVYLNAKQYLRFSNRNYPGFEATVLRTLQEERVASHGKTPAELPGNYVAAPMVVDRALIGCIILYSQKDLALTIEELTFCAYVLQRAVIGLHAHESVTTRAIKDSLTGLFNREHFSKQVQEKLRGEVSMAMVDIDNFKSYNDTYGHIEGDRLLADVAKNLGTVNGIACRWGGEEFALFLLLDAHAAIAEMQRLRTLLETGPRTVSVGLATRMTESIPFTRMLEEADKALYKAKQQGKNKVVQHVLINKNIVVDTEQARGMGS